MHKAIQHKEKKLYEHWSRIRKLRQEALFSRLIIHCKTYLCALFYASDSSALSDSSTVAYTVKFLMQCTCNHVVVKISTAFIQHLKDYTTTILSYYFIMFINAENSWLYKIYIAA